MGVLDDLTRSQIQVLEYLHSYVLENGCPPSRADIARHLGFRSPNAAEELLQRLEAKGIVKLLSHTARGIAPGVRVNAGRPNRRWTAEDLQKIQAKIASATDPAPKAVRPEWNYSLFAPVEFDLPWAPSVNSAYANATSGRIKTTKARNFGEFVWAALMHQRVPATCIAHPCIITLSQYAPDDRGDPDNGIKIVLDTMKRFGVLADDNRKIIKRLVVEDAGREEGGRVHVRIAPFLQAPAP